MRKLLKLLWVLLLIALFFLLILPYISPNFRGLLNNAILPFLPKVSEQFYSMKDLEAENADLRERLAKLESLQDHWNSLIDTNQTLRSISQLPKRDNYKSVVAQVSVRSPLKGNSRFIINRGTESGLKVGHPVLVYDCMFGRIVEVKKNYSVVTTILEESVPVFCRIKGTEMFGLLKGEIKSDLKDEIVCKLIYLPREEPVVSGMLVETSGFSTEFDARELGAGVIPSAIKIGKIKSVSKNEIDQKAEVVLSAKWKSFDYVTILIKEEP